MRSFVSKTILSTFVIALSIASVAAEHDVPGHKIAVQTLDVQNMPVAIEAASIVSDKGRLVSVLQYTLANQWAANLHAVFLQIHVANAGNKSEGGEGWVLKEELPRAGTRGSFSVSLRHFVDPGERVYISVNHVWTDDRQWTVSGANTNRAALLDAAGQAYSLSASQSEYAGVSPFFCPANWCDLCHNEAVVDCTRMGIQGFSCDQAGCTHNWTCK